MNYTNLFLSLHVKASKMRIKHIIIALLVAFPILDASAQDIISEPSDTLATSQLVFPNAFSPNDDGINDKFKAKTHQNLVEFHAYIFNRWGQKRYEWTDPDDGWDGTTGGNPVKDGVYFVLVKARGIDGKVYNIRKDVNLLRGHNDNSSK